MSMSKLFRKKSVAKIIQQLENGDVEDGHIPLVKHLGVRDLTAMGIAAIIGAGIFTTIGKASADGGPAVIFLFLFTAIACGFAAFAYAEFASMIPVSGSAYTYSYVAFGELVAWIIGWSLIMEYTIGNVTVAIGWSQYFNGLLHSGGIHLPIWMTTDILTASSGYKEAVALIQSGKPFDKLADSLKEAHNAWVSAPALGGIRLIANVPAIFITVIITWLVYRGIKETRNASNAMVIIKLAVVLLVIAAGIFYVDTANWSPFAPNGIGGVLKGVSAVFFAYIGFDAISTTAEECKDPQRDLPKGMMWAIIICTVLYIAIALVLTGMVNYTQLAVADPLAFVFDTLNLKWLSGIIAVSAVVAMASVLLVFQLGQPRIWMSMSRDGLLPKIFSRIHPKHRSPSFSTILTGVLVAAGTLFLDINKVTDLCSIGTLFAFVLVCAGVLKLQNDPTIKRGKFKTPYINAKYVMPVLIIIILTFLFGYNRQATVNFVLNKPQVNNVSTLIKSLNEKDISVVNQHIKKTDSVSFAATGNDLEAYLSNKNEAEYSTILASFPVAGTLKYEAGWQLFKHKIPLWIFIVITLLLTYYSITKNLSLIPLLGLLCCLYMMSELGLTNWIWFTVWLLIGLLLYFGYSLKHSKLAHVQK
jgi:basic amino acid/polyamine antiporter, APA family